LLDLAVNIVVFASALEISAAASRFAIKSIEDLIKFTRVSEAGDWTDEYA
jgi:hypothetical protein